jgi:hypothetical protein
MNMDYAGVLTASDGLQNGSYQFTVTVSDMHYWYDPQHSGLTEVVDSSVSRNFTLEVTGVIIICPECQRDCGNTCIVCDICFLLDCGGLCYSHVSVGGGGGGGFWTNKFDV